MEIGPEVAQAESFAEEGSQLHSMLGYQVDIRIVHQISGIVLPHQGRGGPGVGAGNRVGVEAQGGLGSTSRATRQGKNEEAACHDLGRFQGKGGHLASIGFAWARLEPRNPGRSARGSVDPVAALEGPSRCCWQVI